MQMSWGRLRRGFQLFCFFSISVWLLLFGAFVAFPYVRNGADVIAASKVAYLETERVFSGQAEPRILAFGNSRILAGFNPTIYDPMIGVEAQSFNAARPGNGRFVYFLRSILAAGTRPTHVLASEILSHDEPRTWLDTLRHDKELVEFLFPFRSFPRDLTLFIAAAGRNGGLVANYEKTASIAERVLADKGYYFIEAQSHFPGDRLPDNYHLPTDTPKALGGRKIDPELPAFQELASLAAAYGFKVVFIPSAYRIGEFAPPEPSAAPDVRPIPGWPGFYVAGPAYWLYEPRYFSDPVHLNREGAALYSRRLGELTAPIVTGQD